MNPEGFDLALIAMLCSSAVACLQVFNSKYWVDSPSWRLTNWHFAGVTQEWQSRDESSCLDSKSSSLIPGPLCLWAAQESDLLSFNTILHEDCMSNSLFPSCNNPCYPDEMLLLGPQQLPPLTAPAASCAALHCSSGLWMKSITETYRHEVMCYSFFK